MMTASIHQYLALLLKVISINLSCATRKVRKKIEYREKNCVVDLKE